MGNIDSGPVGGRALPGVIRAEFGLLETDDVDLVERLEAYAVAAADADPAAGAQVALAVVAGAHEVVAADAQGAAGPTVGELSTRELLAAALRRTTGPRRTTEPRS